MSTSYTFFDTFEPIAHDPPASSRNGKPLTVFFTASMYAGFRCTSDIFSAATSASSLVFFASSSAMRSLSFLPTSDALRAAFSASSAATFVSSSAMRRSLASMNKKFRAHVNGMAGACCETSLNFNSSSDGEQASARPTSVSQGPMSGS